MMCQETDLEFPPFGIVRVLGVNHCSHGKMDSVGSGKSALGDAIHRVAFDVNRRRYSSLGHYSKDRAGGTFVDLLFELNGKELRIESGFKHKEISSRGEGLRFTYDGTTVERDKLTETRKELVKTIGVIPELAAWTCCLDGDRMDFGDLSQANRVSLIMNAVRAPDWDQMHKRAKKTLDTLNEELTRAEEQLRAAQEAVETHKDSTEEAVDALNAASEAYDRAVKDREAVIAEAQATVKAKVKAYDDAQERVNEAKAAIADCEKKSADLIGTLEKDRLRLKSEVATLRAERDKKTETRATAKANRRAAKEKLDELKDVPETCSTCGKPWDTKITPTQLKAAERELEKMIKAEADADEAHRKADVAVKRCEQDLEDKSDEISNAGKTELSRLSRELQTATSVSNTAANAAQAAKQRFESVKTPPSDSAVVAARATMQDRKRALKAAEASVKQKAANLAESEVAAKAGRYMVDAFGPTGMPNMFLEDVAPELNARAREVSEIMTGGTLLVRFETRRERADGRETAELTTEIENRFGSQYADGTSKGETGLTNLIIAETLAKLSSIQSRVAYRWFDEVINAQDNAVRKGYLQQLRADAHKNRALIFIVDHHAGVEAVADYTLIAEKLTTGTVYRWL